MEHQLNIAFPQYTFDMEKVKVAMLQQEITRLQELNAKKDRTIAAYKGHFTKQKNKK